MKELVFMEERCEDPKMLQDYGVNSEMIKQVNLLFTLHATLCPSLFH